MVFSFAGIVLEFDILILQKKVIRVGTVVAEADFREHCMPHFVKLKIQSLINVFLLIFFTF